MATDKEKEEQIKVWKANAEFMAYVTKDQGLNEEYFEVMFDDIKKLYEEFTQKHPDNKEEKNPDNSEKNGSELNVSAEEPEEKGNTNRDTAAIEAWKKWAGKRNYIFEDTNEEGFSYSINLYKTEAERNEKKSLASIKCNGDNLFVKSDDLDVYREIIRQAKDKKYTSVKLLDNLSIEQRKMLLIACLEADMPMKNAPVALSPKDPLCNDLPAETKEKIKEYNYNSCMAAAKQKIENHKKAHLGEAINLKEILGNETPLFGAMLLCAAKKEGIEVKSEDFFDFPLEQLEAVPTEKRIELQNAVNGYNQQHTQDLYNTECEKYSKLKEANKETKIDIRGSYKDPTMQALAYAACTNLGIGTTNLPDSFEGVKRDYLPEEVLTVLDTYSKSKAELLNAREQLENKNPQETQPNTEQNEATPKTNVQPDAEQKKVISNVINALVTNANIKK